MNTNKENTTIISITREHDKICILEKIIKSLANIVIISKFKSTISTLETTISNLIDSIITNKENNTQLYLTLLNYWIDNKQILDTIILLSNSIAKQIPFLVRINVNEKTVKYIDYINNQDILDLFNGLNLAFS